MARIPSFASVPSIPLSGLNSWQYTTFNALKTNVDLLIGAQGNGVLRAVTPAKLTVANAPPQTMTRVTAEGVGFTISGVTVPSLDDYTKLVVNVQQLANDVAEVRATLNTLIQQLKA
jgi:hypothetical protein